MVSLPEENPEIEPLAGTSERQGVTTVLAVETEHIPAVLLLLLLCMCVVR